MHALGTESFFSMESRQDFTYDRNCFYSTLDTVRRNLRNFRAGSCTAMIWEGARVKMRVIIIDDESAVRYVMRKNLAKLHYIEVVGSFQDTASASLIIKEHEEDKAIVDIRMQNVIGL